MKLEEAMKLPILEEDLGNAYVDAITLIPTEINEDNFMEHIVVAFVGDKKYRIRSWDCFGLCDKERCLYRGDFDNDGNVHIWSTHKIKIDNYHEINYSTELRKG